MKPEDLLLAPELSTEEVTEFLARFGFADPAAADRNLQLMAEDVTTRLAPVSYTHLTLPTKRIV